MDPRLMRSGEGLGAPKRAVEREDAIRCVECVRAPRPGETWQLCFADIGDVVIYCPECAEREFGEAPPAPS